MSEMNNRHTYDFAAALRGEGLKEAERLAPEPDRPSYDFAAALRGEGLKETGRLTPLQEWNQLPDDQRNVNLGEWYKKFQMGEPVEDWQRQALKDFNVWVGDNHPPAGPEINTEPEEGEVEERTQNRLMDWLKDVDWKNAAKEGALMLGPAIFSGVLWETMPQLHQALEYFVGGGIVGGFLTERLLGVLSQAERIHPRFARLARAAAAKRGTGLLIAQISASAGIGIVGAEGLDRWLQIQTHAVQPTVGSGGEGAMVDHPRPVDDSIGQAGGLPPDVQPPADVATANEATQVAQAAAQQAEAAAQVAAQAAEAARIAALQQGPTVAELAAQMPKQTVSEAIYQMIGNVPHRGEVTNILFRAIGDKVNNLNEGAIKAAAEALRPVFDNIDKTVVNSGVSYTEGGRAAVEAMRGFNSPEAQAIRAANMGDLEAAGNLLNNVIGPVIK